VRKELESAGGFDAPGDVSIGVEEVGAGGIVLERVALSELGFVFRVADVDGARGGWLFEAVDEEVDEVGEKGEEEEEADVLARESTCGWIHFDF